MNNEKKIHTNFIDWIKMLGKVIASYFGIISNVFGTILGIFASVLVICFIVGICVYVKVLPIFTEARNEAFDKMVNMSEEDFILSEDTIIYDNKGKKVGSINTGRYKYTKIQKISPYIYNGYIAVEDKRFKSHGGVDVLATLRAGVSLLKNNGAITQGGSTITQQVIKNNLLNQNKTFTRKIAEVLLAPSVEEKFSKDKIMEFYCNSNYYGNRCYGVESASEYYFGKKCADLEPQEAAMLIGLSNSPTHYDPVANPENALKKRNSVLRIMQQENVITKKEYEASVKKKLKILQISKDGTKENYVTSYAIHCAAVALLEKDNFQFKYVFENKKDYQDYQKKYIEEYSKKTNAIRSGGYKIYTSIDMKKQKELQKSVDNGLSYNREKNKETKKYALQGAAVSIDNDSNYVVAIVGGRGTKDLYNRAYLSARQSGSSIKPLIDYTPGFESGVYSPSTLVQDKPIENGPKNAGGSYRGNIRIREAVARSINTIAWQVLETITPKYGLSFLDKMHFRNLSYIDNDNLALSLGGFTEGVRVVDMARGYATLANGGSFSDRTCIKKIDHVSDGTVYHNSEEKKQVYSEDASWLMTDVLKGVLNEPYGTGRALKLENKQIAAGKTGTTNSGKDVWFCGYTKYYTTVVWAGYDTPRAMPGASGAAIAGKIWKNYMDKVHKSLTPQDFAAPDGICLAKYNSDGSIISGTEENGSTKRYEGMDYFSKLILAEKSKYALEVKEKSFERQVLKKIKAFEKLTIKSIADYYTLKEDYDELMEMISAIEDDDIRKEYMTRVKDKYDSLKNDRVDWKKVVKAYEKAKSEENALLAKKKEESSKEAREKQTKENRLLLAKTRINQLKTYTSKPDNVKNLISLAKKALEDCRSYKEYIGLYKKYNENVSYINNLPDKVTPKDYSSEVTPKETPGHTSEPEATPVPTIAG